MKIGFSTGSLALDDVRRGLRMSAESKATAIELSALREEELEPLINLIDDLDLSHFEYVSFHAPSRLNHLSEQRVVDLLKLVAERDWAIVVHPDVIQNVSLWKTLRSHVCLENMDKRKPTGRTVKEMQSYFERLPEATFCFDIGHARQVDPTMLAARCFLRHFESRLAQVHMSYVNSSSHHERLNFEAAVAFRRVVSLIHEDTPIILETPVPEGMLDQEVERAQAILKPVCDMTRMVEC
ncbi:MAG: hypothetical protein R3C59_26195 [Planctomycetaceae bacterium]